MLSIYAKLSGLKVNSYKTRAIWIGCKTLNGETFNHIFKLKNWNPHMFDILGTKYFSKNTITQIEKELKQWWKKIVTPFGHITAQTAMNISKVNHLLNPSDNITQTLQKMHFNLISYVEE